MSIKSWQEFLASQGACFDSGKLIDFETYSAADSSNVSNRSSSDIVVDLSCMSLIAVSGTDSEKFLHGQFTTNISMLYEQSCQFSSWCNAKGQTRATFFIYHHKDVFYILLPNMNKVHFMQQLNMYILQADVKLSDQSDVLIRIGVHTKDEKLRKQIEHTISEQDVYCLRLPKQRVKHCYILVADLDTQKSVWSNLAKKMTAVHSDIWASLDMQAGYVWITLQTTEKFLPQMLGLEKIAGIDYQKGCYSGQEVIARLHFRGKLKRQLYLVICTPLYPTQSGDHIYTNVSKQNIGTVINTLQIDDDYSLLCVINNDVIDTELCLQDSTVLNILSFV